jgi:hypothetical protein
MAVVDLTTGIATAVPLVMASRDLPVVLESPQQSPPRPCWHTTST